MGALSNGWRATGLAGILAAAMAASPVPVRGQSSFRAAWEAGTPFTVSGELTVLYADDFAGRRAELLHMIRDERTGRSFRLRFERQPPQGLRTGMIVKASGRARESEIYVAAADGSGMTITSSTASGPTSASVSGDQRTVVIVANFLDTCVDCSIAAIRGTMFDDPSGLSVDALYRESSQGQVSFSGTVVGPYTINVSSTDTCDIGAWASAADLEATAAGVDLSAYARRVYVMPPNTCPGAGFGTVGGSPSAAWVFTCHLKGVYAHELGHNLGMDHASTPSLEYGDTTDPMAFSSTSLRGVNAPHRQQMGWFAAAGAQAVTASGQYEIAPLSVDPLTATAPQLLTIRKPDTGEHYYLSYRLPLGFDNYIDSTFHNRVSVHRYVGDGSTSRTFLLAGLDDRQSFSDAVNGISVTQVSHGPTGATVRVDFTSTCTAAAPAVSLAPSAQTGAAGSSVGYTVSVSNRDSAECAARTFALSSAVPAGWSASFGSSALTVGPGASGETALTVTSLSSAASGTYPVSATAVDAAHTASAPGSYTVPVPCVTAPPVLSASPLSQEGAAGAPLSYALSLTNADSSGCSPSSFAVRSSVPAGWTASASSSSVTLGPGQSGSVLVTVNSAAFSAAGSYPWTLSAFAADHAAGSVAATYTVLPAPEPADTTAPTAPNPLTASVSQKLKQVVVSWGGSTDNVGVAGYRVSRNGVVVALSAGTTWNDVLPSGDATYVVTAYDAAGNVSAPSNSVKVSVPGGGGGGKKR